MSFHPTPLNSYHDLHRKHSPADVVNRSLGLFGALPLETHFRRAFQLFLATAFLLSPSVCAQNSGWDEEPSAFRAPTPQVAPDFRTRRSAPPPVQDDEASPDRTAFYVAPKPSGNALQGGVSRFGAGAGNRGNQFNAGAEEVVVRVPLQRQKPEVATVPPSMFRGYLDKTHPQFALKTTKLGADALLEVRGKWDDSGHTLRSLGLHFNSIRGGRLKDYDLTPVKVLVINCDGKVPRECLQKVRDWVAGGGFLLTTDWALENFTQRAFPGYIEWNEARTGQDMVSATVVSPNPTIMKGTVSNAYWKLDEESDMVRVLRPTLVETLVRSRDLVREDPDRMGNLAVTFPFGKGRVMHLVGHFDNNATFAFNNRLPDPAPVIGISLRQAIATNFIVAGLDRD